MDCLPGKSQKDTGVALHVGQMYQQEVQVFGEICLYWSLSLFDKAPSVQAIET